MAKILKIDIGARTYTYVEAKVLVAMHTADGGVIYSESTILEILSQLNAKPEVITDIEKIVEKSLHITKTEKWAQIAALLEVEIGLDHLNGRQEGYHVGNFYPNGTYEIKNPPHLNP